MAKPILTKAAIKKYDPTYLLCRDFGHAWFEEGWYRAQQTVCRFLVCGRCSTERHDDLFGAGGKSRHYYYAEGYLIEGRMPRDLVRRLRLEGVKVHPSLTELRQEVTLKSHEPVG